LGKKCATDLGKYKADNPDIHYCYIHSKQLKNKIARIIFNQNNYELTPFQKGLSHYHGNQVSKPLHPHNTYLLEQDQILDIGGTLYKFKSWASNKRDTIICNERVENFIKTGTSRPFYFLPG